MNEKILCVDDEQNILDGFQRHLRRQFTLVTRNSGAEALQAIPAEGPFAVIMSDMQMPGMDGVTFLARAKEVAPNSVRIMLTGNADQMTAMAAVNEGRIFRFLTKPCPPEVLLKALEAAVEQHRLITAEKELLESTLKGCIQVLTEMLAMASPVAMSRTMRIKHYVAQISAALNLGTIWQLELAAMLSQIGCLAIPMDILRKLERPDATLSADETAMLRKAPRIARDLIAAIPRLQIVAEIVAHQNHSFSETLATKDLDRAVVMGASILKAAIDLDVMAHKASSFEQAVAIMERKSRTPGEYNPAVIAALPKVTAITGQGQKTTVPVSALTDGMVLADDIQPSVNGQSTRKLNARNLARPFC
jgi:response regulator RpfG family c-di-GMP phosphodiesterase